MTECTCELVTDILALPAKDRDFFFTVGAYFSLTAISCRR